MREAELTEILEQRQVKIGTSLAMKNMFTRSWCLYQLKPLSIALKPIEISKMEQTTAPIERELGCLSCHFP
jgi:hypothetical protein